MSTFAEEFGVECQSGANEVKKGLNSSAQAILSPDLMSITTQKISSILINGATGELRPGKGSRAACFVRKFPTSFRLRKACKKGVKG